MQVCVYARSNVAACMHACMHAWMDGWMDGWMYVCMFNVCNNMSTPWHILAVCYDLSGRPEYLHLCASKR